MNTLSPDSDQLKYEKVPIIIPSFNPDHQLTQIVHKIREQISKTIKIIIVNDGSSKDTSYIFEEIKSIPNCVILSHSKNSGKGRAIKTALEYIINHVTSSLGAITIDADGQHEINDILSCINQFLIHPDSAVLGCRTFNNDSVPFRSRLGNSFSKTTLRLFHGLKLSDTQTGLRVIPASAFNALLNVTGERYEYETNMLLFFKENQIDIKEVPIKTVYLDDNQSSHFNPITDSIRIYSTFLKYTLSASASFLVDIFLFTILVYFFKSSFPINYIIIATILARISSACFNYLSNKYLVFKTKKKKRSFYRYAILFLFEMSASAFLVHTIVSLSIFNTEWFVKLVVDSLIFCIGFYIQKNWVFKKKTHSSKKILKESKT
ncbi:glycosyltransferase [Marinilactibacillus sp. GCM10026970]|uniref:glycosyltransferase n=1 Tax=Marinilactibacillus sp. GCM10026970 TaxID=3252642 RepID=UPI00360E5AAE